MAKYSKKPQDVEAVQLQKDIKITLGKNKFEAKEGDYLVFHGNGDIEVMIKKDFEDLYQLAITEPLKDWLQPYNPNPCPNPWPWVEPYKITYGDKLVFGTDNTPYKMSWW